MQRNFYVGDKNKDMVITYKTNIFKHSDRGSNFDEKVITLLIHQFKSFLRNKKKKAK